MAIHPTRGSVPHFTMRPHPVLTGTMLLTLVTGTLTILSFLSKEDGTGVQKQRAILTMIITGILLFFQLILATSKLWFPHLWKRNSSHSRHRQHTHHHPSNKDRNQRTKR